MAATGVPATTRGYTDNHVQANAPASDNAVVTAAHNPPGHLVLEKYPQNEIRNGELTYHQQMMQGIEVCREGAGQAPSADC